MSAQGESLRVVPIELPVGAMIHDFAITENYSLIMDLPLTFWESRLHQGQFPFQFERSRPSRFGILPRHGDNSPIRWFGAPPCCVLHLID
ncbi:MAG: carotenoid oxygenase family protein [Leptolyngbyaceae cyanobacterium]